MITNIAAKRNSADKQWTRPELVRLGSIADVAGMLGTTFQGTMHQRS